MGFARSVIGIGALCVAVFYLFNAGNPAITNTFKWMCIATILVLSLMWISMGTPKQTARRPQAISNPTPAEVSEVVEEESNGVDIPEPVTEDSLDGATLRERKLAKIQSAQAVQEEMSVAQLDEAELDGEELVEVTIEDVHVADEFVVEVSPESVENADIAMSINKRKIKHDEIRKRIELRRRGQLADIRASTARMWEEQTAGEDLVKLLQTPGHGHAVLDSPLNPTPGHVYGATFIRIDDSRILKLRTPLDDGFQQVTKKPEPALPPLVGPNGLPLPPLIPTDGEPLALPPLPMPDASNALALLREEINESD